jgi:PKD repeat protein
LHNEALGQVASYINCTLANNTTGYNLINNRNSSSYTNLIVYGNSSDGIFETDPTTATYSLIQGGASGMGNIDGDPLILHPNFFLMEGSPCIDTGNPDLDGDGITWENDPDDQDSDGSRMDMGVFEYDPSVSVPDEFSIYLYDSESYINAGNDASLNLTNNFTIEAWFKLEQWGSDDSDTYNYIVSKVTDSWDSGFTLITNGLGEFYPQKSIVLTLSGPNNAVEYWHTDANTVSLNTWTHVAVTYSSGEITIFINGEEQVINLYDGYTEITTAEIPDHSSIPLYIGNRYDLNRLFAGLIDEVRIWDTVRSVTEINEDLFTSLSGSEDNLVGYWNFNEGTGTTAEDVSLNTNDGIIMGAVHSTDIHDEIISQFTTDSNIQWPSSGGIQFTDKSIAKEGVNIISWVWNFGDGTTSTQQNPLHIYQEDGVYTVSLTVTADNGSSNTYLATGLITVYSIATITSPTLGQEFSAYGDINFSWTSHFNFHVLNWILDLYKSDSLLHSQNINMIWQQHVAEHPYFNWTFPIPEESPTGDDYKCRLNVIVEGDTGWVESDYFTINSPIPTAAELIYPTSVDTFSTHVDNNVPILFTWHPSEDANDDDILYKLIIQLEYFGNSYTEVHENISDTTISIMSNALDPLMNAINPDESILNWYVESFDGYYTVISDPNQFFLNQSILSTDDNQLYPKTFALHQNYPNPFNPVTTLRYDLPEDGFVNITIYDMLGREVKTLINQTQGAGYRSIIWDATNDYGKPVSAGVYLYQIQAGEYMQTKKMVLLK